jgi:uncharacterized DUF497 family protein
MNHGDDAFQSSAEKAAANWRDHGIDFGEAIKVFRDPFAIEWIDNREAYGEERTNVLGMRGGVILHVTYTERGNPAGRKT